MPNLQCVGGYCIVYQERESPEKNSSIGALTGMLQVDADMDVAV
jgi:hypothetical protein